MTTHPKGSKFVKLVVLILGMLLAVPNVFAEPTDSLAGAGSPGTAQPLAALTLSALNAALEAGEERQRAKRPGAAPAEHPMTAPTEGREATLLGEVFPPEVDPARATLAELLLPQNFGATGWTVVTTDDVLAAAIAIGTTPDLEPLNAFRKRKMNLFLKEQPVSIGRTDMLLRLRLRAKMRKAMSVELRF